MIRIRQIEVKLEKNSSEEIKRQISFRLKININDIIDFKINKQSLDARFKPNLKYIYEVDASVKNEDEILDKIKDKDVLKTPDETYHFPKVKNSGKKIVIVGAGPAGLFASYLLAENGYKPLVIERGEKVEDRIKSVEEFWTTGNLNKNSNVQFGEGGAGTFSDGKLNTLTKDREHRMKKVFKIFVDCGANEDILYVNKPHIGTDDLRKVIINMRNKIINMGGVFRYNTCLTDIKINNNKLEYIVVNENEKIVCDDLILAIGHSARDTFNMLYEKGFEIVSKPFAVGIRIMHPQSMINKSQYGLENNTLPSASYKLTHQTTDKRGVYTFCMCPGGYVVNASSEENMLAVNGMSNRARDSKCANSAVIVTVSNKDYGDNPLSGLEFQKELESIAYQKGNGRIPIQLYKDFKENKVSDKFGSFTPEIKGNYTFSNLNEILPKFISSSLIEGIDAFDKKIKGYAMDDAILAGVETRTSSPIKIIRNEFFTSNIEHIYPIGEGAGYAGGITTSAIDGVKVAEIIAKL